MLGNWQEPMGGWCVERKAGRPFPPPRARPVISGVVDELSRLRPRLFERDLRRRAGGTFIHGLGSPAVSEFPSNASNEGTVDELGPHRRQLERVQGQGSTKVGQAHRRR